MNQILLQALPQDSTKIPGVGLTYRWLLHLLPQIETLSGLFLLPLWGTWIGHVFPYMNDLYEQIFSLNGLIYLSIVVGMLPKPGISSRRWLDTNLFAIQSYSFYFLELFLLAYFGFSFSYEGGWLFSSAFSTAGAITFYAILGVCRLSSFEYLKTVVRIYFLTDLGNMLAVSFLSPFYFYNIFISIGGVLLIYLLIVAYCSPAKISWIFLPFLEYDQKWSVLRCLFWGVLSVEIDYMGCPLFYVLEAILAANNQEKRVSLQVKTQG